MLIRVVYKDNVHDYVEDFQLADFSMREKLLSYSAAPGG